MMKSVLLAFLLMLSVLKLLPAQSAYHGGEGNGFCSHKVDVPNASVNTIVHPVWKVTPNPVAIHQTFGIYPPDTKSHYSLFCYNSLGKPVYTKNNLIGTHRFSLAEPGVYIVCVAIGPITERFKIIVCE